MEKQIQPWAVKKIPTLVWKYYFLNFDWMFNQKYTWFCMSLSSPKVIVYIQERKMEYGEK